MSDEPEPHVLNTADQAEGAFANLPRVPASATLSIPVTRARPWIVYGFMTAGVVGVLAVYLLRTSNEVDPNAPRVVVDVAGLHCPIQCGLRVAASLERLPFVLPGSVTANPKTGIVTFAVTSAEAVDEEQVREAIERAGFGVRVIKTPTSQPRRE